MVGLAGALVLNIGTLSPHWVDAMLLAGAAANERGDPGRARPGRRRRDALPHRDGEADPRRGRRGRAARQRGRGGDARRRRGRGARRRVDRRAAATPAELARAAARDARRRRVGDRRRSTTSPTASAMLAVANGHELLAPITGTGCMSTAITGCFLAGEPTSRSRPPPRRSSRSASPARTRPSRRSGPGSFHVALYDALAALDPATLDRRARRGRREAARARRATSRRRGAPSRAARRSSSCGSRAPDRRARRGGRAASRDLGVDLRRQRRRRGGARSSAPTASTSAGPTRAPSGPREAGLLLGLSVASGARRPSRSGAPLHRRRAGLGDAVEGGRRPADRARRAARRSASRVGAGGRDRRHRRDERGRVHPRRAPPASRSSARSPRSRRCGRRSMRLSELGELGLLAELERAGSIARDRARRGAARGRARRHAGRARRGRPLPARLDVAGATSAGGRPPSTSATSPPRARGRRRWS